MEAPAPDWSELPADLLCSILQLLECPDLLRSAAVCTAWRTAFSAVRRISFCPRRQAPCLLYCTKATGQTTLGMYSLSERKAYTMPLPDPPVSNWIGSSHGWLVAMDEKSDLMLLNPITSDKIALPPATAMEHVTPVISDCGVIDKYKVSYYRAMRVEDTPYECSLDEYGEMYTKATLSSDPSAGGCIVMLIHHPYFQLSFAKVGDDHWNWLQTDRIYYADCIYHDGWFYAMAGTGAIDAFNLDGPSVIHKKVLENLFDVITKCYSLPTPLGDVLQICRLEYLDPDAPDGETYISEIEVYKLDFVEQKRVKMTAVGDYALFIGKSTTSCFSIKDYPALMANHVYFTEDDDETLLLEGKYEPRKIGVYDLENKTTCCVVDPEPWMTWLPPIWLTPSLPRTGFQD